MKGLGGRSSEHLARGMLYKRESQREACDDAEATRMRVNMRGWAVGACGRPQGLQRGGPPELLWSGAVRGACGGEDTSGRDITWGI